MTSLLWFRRDLRTTYHPALARAATAGSVVGVFVVDDDIWPRASPRRRAWFAHALVHLRQLTDGALVVRRGRPLQVLSELADQVGASAVYATDDHGPVGRRRDTEVGGALAARGLDVHFVGSNWAVAPGAIRSQSGQPYQVFTPYYRQWLPTVAGRDAPSTDRPVWESVEDRGEIPTVDADLDLGQASPNVADHLLTQFCAGPISEYHQDRDRPDRAGTSMLSPFLHAGLIHPHQIIDTVEATTDHREPGPVAFVRELAFRDFYAEVLFRHPATAWQSMKGAAAHVECDTGPSADERFDAWCAGRTGIPMVDAGMRQLAATGWMHNRVRMLTASFLTKHLHLPWQRGAAWFLNQLVDGDVAANQHGWQWVAGTGTDASPYHRIFNPVRQGERFDPEGSYVRRWIPELAGIGAPAVHQPWVVAGGPPAPYPLPIVDLAEERAEALARMERARTVAATIAG